MKRSLLILALIMLLGSMVLISAVRTPIYYVLDYTKPAIINFEYMPKLTCWYKSDKFKEWKKYADLVDGEPLKFYAIEDGVYQIKATSTADAPTASTSADAIVYVDTRSPVIKITSPVPGEIYSGNQKVPVQWKITDGIKISRTVLVEVGFVDENGEVTWKPITRIGSAYQPSPMQYQASKTGIQKLLFRASVTDDVGHYSVATMKAPIIIDNVAPVTKMGHLEIKDRVINFDYAYNDEGDSPLAELKLLYRKLGTEKWEKLGIDNNTYSPMTAQLPEDGRYELMTVATDYAGNMENKMDAEKSILIDTEAPVLKFTNFNESKQYLADQKVKIEGEINDLDLDEYSVSLFFSENNGRNWSLINSEPVNMNENKFSYDWIIPEATTTQAMLKVYASDMNNHKAQLVTKAPFEINLRENPEAMIVNVHTIAGGVEFGYQILGIGTREISEVQLWKGELKENVWSWKEEKKVDIVDAKDEFGTIDYQGATANLGFLVRCITKTGEKEAEPKENAMPETYFKGFVPIPRAQFNSMAEVDLLKGGQPFTIGWKATTANECMMDIDYSFNEGKTWQKVEHDIDIPKTGLSSQNLWNLPKGTHPRVMIRTSLKVDGFYGTSYTYCDVPLRIDGADPVGRLLKPESVKVVGNKAISNAEVIEFPHNFCDIGLSGLKDMQLWLTVDRAEPVLVNTFNAGQKITYNVPDDGVHSLSFRVIASDKIGNQFSSRPFVFEVDRKPAVVALTNFNDGGVFLSDSEETITWKIDDTNPVEKPIHIYIRRADNMSWELVAGPIENNGIYNWHVPRYLVTSNCEIRILSMDEAGNVGVAITGMPFGVSVHNEPVARAIEPTAFSGGLGHNINVKFGVNYSKKTKPLGVHMFVTNDNGKTYKLWRTVKGIEGNSEFVAPKTGIYGFTFVAFDNRGFTEEFPQSGDIPELLMDVQLDNDVDPYSMRIIPDNQEYNAKDKIVVRWFLRGNAPIADSVKLEVSIDSGKSWKEYEAGKLKSEATFEVEKAGVYFVRLTFTDLFGKKQELCRQLIVK